jgi:D-alanine-D-alanine ligase
MGNCPDRKKAMSKKHIAVLMGGWSSEREVSLTSGKGIVAALETLGHKVTAIDMDRNVAQRIAEVKPDIVFNALHGTPGEDGAVQGMLDLMGVTYTHSGLTASAVAMDKQLTKTILTAAGIRMPGGRVVESKEVFKADPLPRPYVLKPVNEGSSVGVAIVTDDGNYGNPVSRDVEGPWNHYEELLAEPFIAGRELTVSVVGDEALAVTELRATRGFYDFDAKYTDGLTQHIVPADIHADATRDAMQMALDAHRALGCKGVTRSDFRYDDTKNNPGVLYLLEVNTQPGMTPLSLVPEQAKYRGMTYEQLVQRILDLAEEGK